LKSLKIFRQEGKPEAMLDNIAKGKLARFFKDNTLVNQDYIKDNKMSVATYVKSLDKDLLLQVSKSCFRIKLLFKYKTLQI
jgi:translation elongation factor EF-Ts